MTIYLVFSKAKNKGFFCCLVGHFVPDPSMLDLGPGQKFPPSYLLEIARKGSSKKKKKRSTVLCIRKRFLSSNKKKPVKNYSVSATTIDTGFTTVPLFATVHILTVILYCSRGLDPIAQPHVTFPDASVVV